MMNEPFPPHSPPVDRQALLQRALRLAGYTYAELAALAGLTIPRDLRRDKGWVGLLLERCLGASSGSKAQQDFPRWASS